MGTILSNLWGTTASDARWEEESDSSGRLFEIENQSLQPKSLRNPMVTILKEILREKISLNDESIKENNAVLREFYDTFVDEMKRTDEIFKLLYREPYYTGSYYSYLRISQPDEYDINLVLCFPFKPGDLDVEFQPQAPSFVKYKLKNVDRVAAEHQRLLKFFKGGYLMPDEIRRWIQSVVDKTMQVYRTPGGLIEIRHSAAGPARTFKLRKRNRQLVDVDLVPAIKFTLSSKPPGIDGGVYAIVQNKMECFLIPKPYQNLGQAPISDLERSRLWRTHFPDVEKQFIYNLGCVKPVIKLLKLLRDTENWKILASYYLKTVVMWMVLENPQQDYWQENKMGVRFLDALKKLNDFIKRRNIPYFFSTKHNLINKMHELTASNISGRLCAIIRDIEQDPFRLWRIFDVEPTFSIKHLSLL